MNAVTLSPTPPVEERQQPRPSVLAITSELPWPLNTGGHLRSYYQLRALAKRFGVRLVVPVLPDHDGDRAAFEAASGVRVVPVPVGPRRRWREALRALGAAARGKPYVMFRRHLRGPVRQALEREIRLAPPDVVYCDHLDSYAFRPAFAGLPFVLDMHNVYSQLVGRAALEQDGHLKRLYLRREAQLLDHVEARAVHEADAVLAVSEADRRHLQALGAKSVELVPNGVDCALYADLPTGRGRRPPLILYVGAMSWGPNERAAQFLAETVLPQVRQRFPFAALRVVGRDPTPAVQALAKLPGVEITGGVPDVRPHLAAADVLAVALEAGGGTRLKILEAFAAGLPVVSTTVGVEGIDANDHEHLLIADRDEFPAAVRSLLENPELGLRLARNARELAQRKYDWERIGELARGAVSDVLLRHAVHHAH